MNKARNMTIFRKVLVACLIGVVFYGVAACEQSSTPGIISAGTGINIVLDESYFVGYTVNGDTVFFDYALTFENTTDDDFRIPYVDVSFSRNKLRGWIRYEKFYSGYEKETGTDFFLHAGERKTVVLSFKGEYLGGEVTDAGTPLRIMLLQTEA